MARFWLLEFFDSPEKFQHCWQLESLKRHPYLPCHKVVLSANRVALISREKGVGEPLEVSQNQKWLHWKKKKYSILSLSPLRPLIFHLPLVQEEAPSLPSEVVIYTHSKEVAEQELAALLRFGAEDVEVAQAQTETKMMVHFLRWRRPSFFFLRRWQSSLDIHVFTPHSPGLFFQWGWTHPWRERLQSNPKEWLFWGKEQILQVAPLDFSHHGFELSLGVNTFERLTPLEEGEPKSSLQVKLSLIREDSPDQTSPSPSLWALSEQDLQALVDHLEEFSFPLQKELYLAKCKKSDGPTLYLLHKKGRHPFPRTLSLEGQALYAHPYSPQLYIPQGWRLSPVTFSPQSLHIYLRKRKTSEDDLILLFPQKDTIATETQGHPIVIWLVSSRSFRPFSEVLSFWLDSESKRLEELALQIPIEWEYQLPRKDPTSRKVQPPPSESLARQFPSLPYLESYHSAEFWTSLAKEYRTSAPLLAQTAWAEALWWEKEENRRTIAEEAQKDFPSFPSVLLLSHQQILERSQQLYQEIRQKEGEWPLKLRWLAWKRWAEVINDPLEKVRQGEKLIAQLHPPPKQLRSFFTHIWTRELRRRNQEWGREFVERLWQDWCQTNWAFTHCRQRILAALTFAYFELHLHQQALALTRQLLAELFFEEGRDYLILASLARSLHHYGHPEGEGFAQKVFQHLELLLPSSDFPKFLHNLLSLWSLFPGPLPPPWRTKLDKLISKSSLSVRTQLLGDHFEVLEKLLPSGQLLQWLEPLLAQIACHPRGEKALRFWRAHEKKLPKGIHLPILPLEGSFEELHLLRHTLVELYLLSPTPSPLPVDSLTEGTYSHILTAKILAIFHQSQGNREEGLRYFERMWQLIQKVQAPPGVMVVLLSDLLEVLRALGGAPWAEEVLQLCYNLCFQVDFTPAQRLSLFRECSISALGLGHLSDSSSLWKNLYHSLYKHSLQSPIDFLLLLQALLEGGLQHFCKEASPIWLSLEKLLKEVSERASEEVHLEPSRNAAYAQFAQYYLTLGQFEKAEQILEDLLPHLPQSLSYNFQMLSQYPQFIDLFLALPLPSKYHHLYQLFHHFYPHLHRQTPFSEQMVTLIEKTILQMFQFPQLPILEEIFLQDWSSHFRKDLLQSLLLHAAK